MLTETIRLPAQGKSKEQVFKIYRGDLECNIAPGNKQHKLKYHLIEAKNNAKHMVATFGGPHSNHIAAFVARCHQLNIKPLIVVRGETWAELTPTLRRAVNQGAILFPSQRSDYRLGLDSEVKRLIDDYYQGEIYWVPEGGSGKLGVNGCVDWANSIHESLEGVKHHVCISSGTGATAAGFAASKFESVSIFSALKGVKELAGDVTRLCQQSGYLNIAELQGFDESIHGGFGKVSDSLVAFLEQFKKLNPNLILDPVYTSKMIYRVNDLLKKGEWPHKKTLFIHTGGLQGWLGVNDTKCPYDKNLFV